MIVSLQPSSFQVAGAPNPHFTTRVAPLLADSGQSTCDKSTSGCLRLERALTSFRTVGEGADLGRTWRARTFCEEFAITVGVDLPFTGARIGRCSQSNDRSNSGNGGGDSGEQCSTARHERLPYGVDCRQLGRSRLWYAVNGSGVEIAGPELPVGPRVVAGDHPQPAVAINVSGLVADTPPTRSRIARDCQLRRERSVRSVSWRAR